MVREGFKTVRQGLEGNFPLRLYHKAKRLFWDPQAISLELDQATFRQLAPEGREAFLHLASLFVAGEEAVTLDLLPLVRVIAQEGRLEEEMYLTTFLLEEAKHVEFFSRLLEAMGGTENLERFHGPHYRRIFYEELPQAMNRLLEDPSPQAQVEAAVTYNMIVEGVLAETGYYAYRRAAERLGAQGLPLPGTLEGLRHVQQDESRHIAYGLYLIARQIAQDPGLFPVVEKRMAALLPHALGVVQDVFQAYPAGFPLGLDPNDFLQYALGQFQKRYRRLELAGQKGLGEVEAEAEALGEEA